MKYLLYIILSLLIIITTVEAGNPVRIEFIDDNGDNFREIRINNGIYLEAKRGWGYGIRLQNISNKRIGVLISVDGLNIITRKKSLLDSPEKMYILDPYETTTYKGWRTGKNRINKFFFTSTSNSYARKKFGNPYADSKIGIIGIAIFNEQYQKKIFKPENNPIAKYYYEYLWSISGRVKSVNSKDIDKIRQEIITLKEKLKNERPPIQTTNGDKSPIINNNYGTVTIY